MGNARHRTQISLEDWQYQVLIEMSRKTKKNISSIGTSMLNVPLSGIW